MSKYIEHLRQMYSEKTFNRKVDYLKYNLSDELKRLEPKGGAVLEIGPGMGECIYTLNQLGISNVDIVDNDREILNLIKRKYKVRRAILSSDVSLIDKTLGKYDLIMMIQVLEHIVPTRHKRIIQTLFKHLKNGGRAVLVVPNANNPLGLVERYADLQHHTSFTEQSLKDLLNESDLKNFSFEIKGFEIPPYSLLNILRIVLQKILHFMLFLVMIINGGNFFKVMTPNIMLLIKKR